MLQPSFKTPRCLLRPIVKGDANWLFELINDQDVIAYIEGIKWFNSDINATKLFIDSMNINFQKGIGVLWSIIYNGYPIGMIMVNDLNEESYYTFALTPHYRGLGLMKECITAVNSYFIDSYHQIPSISSLGSNISALRLMKKLSMLHSDKNYKS